MWVLLLPELVNTVLTILKEHPVLRKLDAPGRGDQNQARFNISIDKDSQTTFDEVISSGQLYNISLTFDSLRMTLKLWAY